MALDPWTIGAAAVPSIFQGISGIIQSNKGKRMAQKNVRPTYYRPSEVRQSLALSEQNFLNGVMPGTSVARNNISASSANAIDNIAQAASSSGDVLDGITKVQFNEGLQTNDLAVQQADYKQRQLAGYQDQLDNSARFADKEFAYNQDAPYQEKAAAASALIGAGNQNTAAALGDVSSLATTVGLNGGFSKGSVSNTNTLGQLPVSASSVKVNPGMGQSIVWDPYLKKMKVQA